jgi:[acyl-carrier-protein] S-malonyltransferase
MVPAGERLAEVLAAVPISPLQLPVVTNVEAAPNQDADRVRDLLVRQVSAPVRWDESVRMMASSGVERFIELGPGKVLSGLVKRIAKGAKLQNVEGASGIAALAGKG